MIPSLHCLLGGYRVFSADRRNAAPLLELCRRHTILYENFRHLPDGGIILRFPRASARRLLPLCARHGVILTPAGEGGIPTLGRHLLRRAFRVCDLRSKALVFVRRRIDKSKKSGISAHGRYRLRVAYLFRV